MYENYDPFEEIQASTYEALDDKTRVPEVPAMGSLDLTDVLKADYAFS